MGKWLVLKSGKSVKSLAGLSNVRAPLKPAKKGEDAYISL